MDRDDEQMRLLEAALARRAAHMANREPPASPPPPPRPRPEPRAPEPRPASPGPARVPGGRRNESPTQRRRRKSAVANVNRKRGGAADKFAAGKDFVCWATRHLKRSEAVIWLAMWMMADGNGIVTASCRTYEMADMGHVTASRAINRLVALGLISVAGPVGADGQPSRSKHRGVGTRYRVNFDPIGALERAGLNPAD